MESPDSIVNASYRTNDFESSRKRMFKNSKRNEEFIHAFYLKQRKHIMPKEFRIKYES